jgi:hypothetical protein
MTADTNLQRRIADYYAAEPPLRAPDRVLLATLATIDSTPQRRGLAALRRYFDMPSYIKLAAAAVVLIAVGGLAVWQLAPAGPGGRTSPPPTPTAAPTPTEPPRSEPTYVPPALTETFTSDLHGLSLSYPDGWTAQAATQPWSDGDPPQFGDPAGDLLHDPGRPDHLFIGIASQPLGDTPFDQWLSGFLVTEGCTRTDNILIDGADQAVDTSCDLALASSDGRGYVIVLHTSGDDADLRAFDTAAWFADILATLQLRPEDAVDEAPTASP